MSQENNTTKKASGKHLTYIKRQIIEFLYNKEHNSIKKIAEIIGCSEKTIRRELKRGMVTLRNTDYTTREEYSADKAQEDYEKNVQKEGLTSR